MENQHRDDPRDALARFESDADHDFGVTSAGQSSIAGKADVLPAIHGVMSDDGDVHRVDWDIPKGDYPVRRFLNKATLDCLTAAVLLVLFAPLMIGVAILIKLTSPGPIFFKQYRRGCGGTIFFIYKFRSMYVQQENEVSSVKQAIKNDPRVTFVGRVLRKTSIDELPQFINVMKGDMSIVGPRPHALDHDDLYVPQLPDYMRRYDVKPGITGWAQINGFRGETQHLEKMARRVEHDLYYIRNKSIRFDFKIMIKTVTHGFFNKNAY